MGKILKFFKKLFGGRKKKTENEIELSITVPDMEPSKIAEATPLKYSKKTNTEDQRPTLKGKQPQIIYAASPLITSNLKRQQAYFIQVGFDFGTSYSKCICRDVITDNAWVHIPSTPHGHELPFLISSVLLFIDGKFQYVHEPGIHYPEEGIYHLKPALVKIALNQMDAPELAPYKRFCAQFNIDNLCDFVEACAVYFLAGTLGTVRKQIRKRLDDFGSHPYDFMAVNMAVPIADVEQPAIRDLLYKILCESWSFADNISGYPSLHFNELEEYRRKSNSSATSKSVRDACFIYPEVSANVQGFVRSRVASEGMYLFSDIGAATVDQSTFIFIRKPDDTEHLTYLHAKVLPLGSSQIEFLATEFKGGNDLETLERFRLKKERGDNDQELMQAKHKMAERLSRETTATLAGTKRKLEVSQQMRNIKLLFGGGGHCEYPYERAITGKPFSCNLFHPPINPRIIGLPLPADLDFDKLNEETKNKWMKRLYVAYGLSFWRGDLATFSFPYETEPAEPRQITRDIPEAPSKDQC